MVDVLSNTTKLLNGVEQTTPKGFRLEFFFDTNPSFKNSLLTKIYHMIDENEHILEKTIETEIKWYPGKCLTQKLLKEKTIQEAKAWNCPQNSLKESRRGKEEW